MTGNGVTHQVEDRAVDPHRADKDGEQEDLDRPRPQRGKVEVGRPVVLRLVLLLVLVLDLPLLALQVEDGPSLRVVEGGRAVEGAQQERDEDDARHGLKTQPPADRAETR